MNFIYSILFISIFGCSTVKKNDSMSEIIEFRKGEKHSVGLPVVVGGSKKATFIFDTGIGLNLISKELCEALSCVIDGEHRGKRMSGQEVIVPLTTISSIQLGTHKVVNTRAGVINIKRLFPDETVDGVISLDFFKNTSMTVDYKNHQLTLEGSEEVARIAEVGHSVEIEPLIKKPSYEIRMPLILPNKEKIVVVVDTGSQALILHEKFMKSLEIDKNNQNVRKKTGKDKTNNKYVRYFTKLNGNTSLPGNDDYSLDSIEVMFQDIIYDGLIGTNFFDKYLITYDLPNKRLIFQNY